MLIVGCALEAAHAAIKQLIAAIDDLKASIGKKKLAVAAKTIAPRVLSRDRGQDAAAARPRRCGSSRSSRATRRSTPFWRTCWRRFPRTSSRSVLTPSISSTSFRKRRCATRCSTTASARRPEVRRDPSDLDRSRRPAARHGSVVFTRGETQALVTCTLGTADDEQKIEHVTGEQSTGASCCTTTSRRSRSAKRDRSAARAAARSATAPWPSARSRRSFPAEDKFAYTIRIVSDILESNGSSSMASVCGGSLALMDAGVPIKAPVAGIAMGLIMDEKSDKYAVLSDIAGAEDHYGDMDFKVAGTREGITALQMDIKVTGITSEIMAKALEQARAGRLHILDEMAKTLARPAQRHVDVRAAHHHHQDPGRQDPRRHRPRRQDDPQHHRADRREDRRRGRRHASTSRRRTASRRRRRSASSRS